MRPAPIGVFASGLVTSVGLSAAASCAAIRAKISNPTETRFANSNGDWIIGHRVPLRDRGHARAKLAEMAAIAIAECLEDVSPGDWSSIPLLLCIAERERPGRHPGIDEELFGEIQRNLGVEFAASSLIIPHGRVAAGLALRHARNIIESDSSSHVLVASSDSLMTWATLKHFEREGRLLKPDNSNGFIPGEGAAAMLVGPGDARDVVCTGLGFATEPSTWNSDQPLRADGLSNAIRTAMVESACTGDDLDFRITDLAGEQYYFKEASLAFSKAVRSRKQEFPIWHPAESIGEAGATSGLAGLVVATHAVRGGYAPGPNVLWHAAADSGQRAALILQLRRS